VPADFDASLKTDRPRNGRAVDYIATGGAARIGFQAPPEKSAESAKSTGP